MCNVCGCGGDESHHHHHDHDHNHLHTSGGDRRTRILRVERDILSKNKALAERNRDALRRSRIASLNLVSGPGAGKTTLLTATIARLPAPSDLAVIEGDQQTRRDADRIVAAGARALQINTGKGCHLDAEMVAGAVRQLAMAPGGMLFIENVGNLVCPADFDLGETRRVVLLSVTEGDDKPLKYPNIFASADLMVLTKIDLLPHVDFDVDACVARARQIHPTLDVLLLSARSGEGMPAWLAWLARVAAEVDAGA